MKVMRWLELCISKAVFIYGSYFEGESEIELVFFCLGECPRRGSAVRRVSRTNSPPAAFVLKTTSDMHNTFLNQVF